MERTPLAAVRHAVLNGGPELAADAPLTIGVDFEIAADVLFDVDLSVDLVREDGTLAWRRQLRQDGWDPSWLPRGTYRAYLLAPKVDLPSDRYRVEVALWHHVDRVGHKLGATALPLAVLGGDGPRFGPKPSWHLESTGATPPVEQLSWRRGAADWFYKHFDHAARTVMSYMLDDSPLLRGRILDVGCGDGITDLGIALRKRPEKLVGIDPFRGYERLPAIAKAAHLALDRLPDCLEFLPADANDLPFPDDSFDVALSWGSLEHIVPGYERALAEIRRVLKPGGLLFAHPGLYYSDIGNHLGEFDFAKREPYVHLKRSREELREMILGSEPSRMDRAGDVATPAQYWQWFTELNPITVGSFEQQLRALDFEPWRVAIRTHDRVDYTAALQRYSFVDLAAGELYVSAVNRKK